ncbi:MAG: sialate O-acetylesterase [Tannerellaceae bacterium]|jgi:sialate O-acetylesterase|nr:sialate O-acetylesterase [Tannerellaceae bacterium]
MRTQRHILFALLLVMAISLPISADIKLPAIISDNMVLQQQTQVAVWGWTKPKSSVSVTTSWNGKSQSAQSDANGFWKVKLQTPAAGFTPYTITIASAGRSRTLKNVLIGEVWLCSGQSNMEMPMKGYLMQPIENGPDDILNSSNAAIRCFTVTRASKSMPQEDCAGAWEIAGPQTTPNFTATGYYFARLINKVVNVPVGFINTSWGGTGIPTWMPPAALKDIPEKPVEFPADETNTPSWRPTALYNGMIHPLVNYCIRGAIWYQGEANRGEPELYAKMFERMVREWRNAWNIGDFPFYYCQIAPYKYGGGGNSGFLREAQAKLMTTTPNTGMAVLTDAESPDCIHPPKKKDAGERMALWALAKTYGIDIHYRSPEVKSVETNGQLMIIEFELFGSNSGLTTNGKQILGFQIAGDDKRFTQATATLRNNKVYIFAPTVSKPVAARYIFDDASPSEIFTVEGNLPVSSFRTDTWKD